MKEKLNSGLINSIWLQFGSDIKALSREIKFLKKYIETNFDNKIEIYGSLFVPSKQFLARFKFRPWKNVFLSNEYLNSIDHSIFISKSILNLYLVNNICPLVETECSNLKQLEDTKKLFYYKF